MVGDNLAYLDEIKKRCLEAPGFLLFSAVLRNTPDGLVLDFDYRRFHLNIEDAKIALKKLEEQVMDDFKSM